MGFKIGVFGSAVGSEEAIQKKAYLIGKEIAKREGVVISGGCWGLPYMASKGAFENQGKTVAYSPGRNLKEHTIKNSFPKDVFTEFVFVPETFPFGDDEIICRKYRNVISCAEADAGIIIGGRIGTINEFTILYDLGKVVGMLEGSGGSTDLIPKIIESANKASNSVLIQDEDPSGLVEKIYKELEHSL